MVQYSDCDSGTLVPDRQSGGTLVASALAEELGTMVINSDPEDESTMKSECFLALGPVIWIEVYIIETFFLCQCIHVKSVYFYFWTCIK